MENGGPAFPTPEARTAIETVLGGEPSQGMSTRTWLSGMALSGLCADMDRAMKVNNLARETLIGDVLAQLAVSVADSTLQRLDE